jgi:hypothetical protein
LFLSQPAPERTRRSHLIKTRTSIHQYGCDSWKVTEFSRYSQLFVALLSEEERVLLRKEYGVVLFKALFRTLKLCCIFCSLLWTLWVLPVAASYCYNFPDTFLYSIEGILFALHWRNSVVASIHAWHHNLLFLFPIWSNSSSESIMIF